MTKQRYTPSDLREFAALITVPAAIIESAARDMESQGVEAIELQIKSPISKWIKPLTDWAEEFRFDAAKKIHKAAKQQAAFNAGVAYRQQKEAEEAPKKPRKKGGGK